MRVVSSMASYAPHNWDTIGTEKVAINPQAKHAKISTEPFVAPWELTLSRK